MAGQSNGLCGAAVPGGLYLVVGYHTARVPFRVETGAVRPPVPAEYQDVVEVSLTADGPQLLLVGWGGESTDTIELGQAGSFRVRYCAWDFRAGQRADTRLEGAPAVGHYLLQLWPELPSPDEVLRCSGPAAQYWHDQAQSLPPPPTAEERAAAEAAQRERDRVEQEEWRRERLRRDWGGRMPTPRLLELGGRARWIANHDRALLDTFEGLDADVQRRYARWLARRAFQHAGLDQQDWVAPTLAAMDRGDPLEEPFTDLASAFTALHENEQTLSGRGEFSRTIVTVLAVTETPQTAWDDVDGPINRSSFALPTLFAAVKPDPLTALVETFAHTVATFNGQRQELVDELRQRLRAV